MSIKRRIVCLVLSLLLCVSLCPAANAAQPNISAKAAVLIEADSGEIIFAKNENEKLSMASTTKIMTALLLLENCQPDDTITVTEEMVAVEGSSMGLKAGETVTAEALLYGMMMSSGNDAANTAAYMVSGDRDSFINLMNQRAAELGAENTSFETPSGLDGENHYSTAHDMAKIAASAMQNDVFREAVSKQYAKVTYGEPKAEHTLKNHNRLLSMYEGCIGIKTGFTKKSGRCLVSCAERNDVRLICVTLHDPDDWDDHMALFDYGFSIYENYTTDLSGLPQTADVVGGTIDFVTVEHTAPKSLTLKKGSSDNITTKIIMPRFIYAPVQKGQIIGRVEYYLDGQMITEIDLTAGFSINEKTVPKKLSLWQRICDFFAEMF